MSSQWHTSPALAASAPVPIAIPRSSYLQHLPVDELKLNRAFLADLNTTRTAAIVKSTVELAHALDLRLVAEGVEDQASLDLLRRLGCDSAQGFYLSRPQPAAAITSWLGQQCIGPTTADPTATSLLLATGIARSPESGR